MIDRPATPTVSQVLRRGPPDQAMLIIDFHTHLGRWFHWWFSEFTADHLVARMDTFGIRTSISHHTLPIGTGDISLGNTIVGEGVRKHPGRIEGATVVNPNYPHEIRPELQRCLETYGMRIVKLHAGTHRYPLNGKGYWPAYEFASEHKLIVVAHGPPKELAEMAGRHPGAIFVTYHVTSDAERARMYGELTRANPNFYLETCGPMTQNIFERLVEEAGEDRILFGTDALFLALPPQIGRIASSRMTEDQKRKILGLNAKRLLDRLHGAEA